MGTNEIKYILNGQLADNTVTGEDKNDKILVLVPAGSVDKERVISEMMEMNPGMERETVTAIVNLEQRVVQKLILTGHQVNMGLYQARAQFTGVVENHTWNPDVNSIYVSFTQGAGIREAMGRVGVNITGEKSAAMYIAGTQDTATRATDATATAGRNFTITGSRIKVMGTDPLVGITMTSVADKTVTNIPADMWAMNDPSKIIFIIPAGLADGAYTLRITTQYSGSGKTMLKTPRSQEYIITLGSGGGGDVEDPTV